MFGMMLIWFWVFCLFVFSSHLLLLLFSHWINSFVTLWTVAHQVPLSMGSPRQEYWSGLPFPSPGDLPDPGIQPVSPALADASFTTSESHSVVYDSLRPHELYSPWNSPGQNTGGVAFPFFRGSQPRSHTLQADFLPAEPQGKPLEKPPFLINCS